MMLGGKLVVYLSGGIQGLAYDEAKDWRAKATDKFEEKGYIVADPLRGRKYSGTQTSGEKHRYSLNEIFSRDLFDLKISDILFVEFTRSDRNYIGTTSEVAIASYVYDTPIVVWAGSKDRVKELEYSWMHKWASKIIADLDEAIDFATHFIYL